MLKTDQKINPVQCTETMVTEISFFIFANLHFQVNYFDLSSDNPDGCMACACDIGGATSLDCGTGPCPCRELIGGRQCNTGVAGNYVPTFDHMTYEAEFSVNATVSCALLSGYF